MARVQLALNVTDLDAAIDFYSRLFATTPAKRRPGYANFAIVDPPLKLVLIQGHGAGGTLNHLGVEVASADEVAAGHRRLSGAGLSTATEEQVTCCYALQDKVWVDDPDGSPWELYTVLADAEMAGEDDLGRLRTSEAGTCGPGACCSTPTVEPACCDQPAADRVG